MPDLNFGPPPSRSPLPAVLIALGVLATAAAAVFLLNPHKTAELSVTGTRIYAARTETKALEGHMHIIGAAPHVDNDLYVVVNVKITDKLRLPLFIKDETAVLTGPDGSILEAAALREPDLKNLYAAFPQVRELASAPLARDTRIDPEQTAEGMVLLHFPGATEQNWKGRQSATITFHMFHQAPQIVTVP